MKHLLLTPRLRFKSMLIIIVRWLIIAFLLSYVAALVMVSQNTFDQFTKPYCPPDKWHEGEFWAHCAFPPISIIKSASMYFVYLILSLLIVLLLAPKPKLFAARILLFIFTCIPSALVLFGLMRGHFSWTLSFITLGTAVFAMLFILAVKLSHNASLKRGAKCTP